MNRRAFITSVAAGVLGPRVSALITPSPSPAPAERPAPIDLGEGIVLIDYRVYPSDRPAVIGEIRNDNDHMVDAPVLSLSWPDAPSTSAFAWVSPMIPVIKPGGSVPIFGPLPDSADAASLLNSANFSLCSPVKAGKYTELQQEFQLDLRMLYERHRDLAFKGIVQITNTASITATQIEVFGVVRDGEDRIAGMTQTVYISRLKPDDTTEFNIWIDKILKNKANPVPLLKGLNYSVDVRAGTRGPAVAPGCVFGKPWQ